MNKFIEILTELFTMKCPDCGGRLHGEFYDTEIDKMVYQCEGWI